MKESLRRVILFTMIVIIGSVMILFDVPLILMIPMIIAAGIVILFLLGAVTVADIRSVFSQKISQKPKKPKKIGIIQRLDEMKFFEKKPVHPEQKSASPQKKEEARSVFSEKISQKPKKIGIIRRLNEMKFFEKKPVQTPEQKKELLKSTVIKNGAVSHLRLFISSLGSLGTILKERSKHEKKVEHINELLDKTVSEKVKGSALASAGNGVDTRIPLPVSGGALGQQEQVKDQDPFLSLSADEFDASLLDGLDDQDPLPSSSSLLGMSPTGPTGGSGLTINEPDIPTPSLDIGSVAGAILNDNADGLEEFKGLEGGELIDQDFGDLDNLNFDDVDLDVDLDVDIEEETPAATGSMPSLSAIPGKVPLSDAAATVKTDWIPSDAPQGTNTAENEISTHDEMASFAAGASGSDDDLLSSLASDVKHVKKEKNTSLLRDLKDFKAPADDIENELKDICQKIKAARSPEKKTVPGAKRMK